jgi:hypothetical protein
VLVVCSCLFTGSSFLMKALQAQLSPTSRYYLSKLLKSIGGQNMLDMTFPVFSTEQVAQLENLLHFHQSLNNQHASSVSNLDQVAGLILALLQGAEQPPAAPQTPPSQQGFGQASIAEEVLIDEGLVDKPALMAMPLPELVELIEALRQSVERKASFVNDQEEELSYQRQAIEELQQKIHRSSEYDAIMLKTELANEQQSYDLLDAALIGQRKRVQEEQQILQTHQSILRYRQES